MDETAVPAKGRFWSILRLLILLLLLVAGFWGYMRFYANQRAGKQQVYDNLEVLDARIDGLERSIVLHETRLKELEEATQKIEAVQNAAPAATTPATIATPAVATGASDERVAALEKELALMKAASPMQDTTAIAHAIRELSAFHHLSEKVIGGKPFATELAAFEEVAGPDESAGSPVATLAPYADSGIPTFATLLVTFDQSAESLNAAEAVPPADASFWDRFKYNLRHLVTVRRVSDANTGHSASAIVGRAQAHLEREEIEAAVAEIKSLPEGLRGNFAAWLDDAQTVTEAPSLIDQLQEAVMQKAFAGPSANAAPAAVSAPAPSTAPAQSPAPSPSPQPSPSPSPTPGPEPSPAPAPSSDPDSDSMPAPRT